MAQVKLKVIKSSLTVSIPADLLSSLYTYASREVDEFGQKYKNTSHCVSDILNRHITTLSPEALTLAYKQAPNQFQRPDITAIRDWEPFAYTMARSFGCFILDTILERINAGIVNIETLNKEPDIFKRIYAALNYTPATAAGYKRGYIVDELFVLLSTTTFMSIERCKTVEEWTLKFWDLICYFASPATTSISCTPIASNENK